MNLWQESVPKAVKKRFKDTMKASLKSRDLDPES